MTSDIYTNTLNALNRGAKITKDRSEQNSITSILNDAMSSDDPAVLQQSMAKILSQVSPENRNDAIQLLQGMAKQAYAKKEKEKTNKALKDRGYSEGFGDLPDYVQKEEAKGMQKNNLLNNLGLGGQASNSQVMGGAGVGASPNQMMGGAGVGASPNQMMGGAGVSASLPQFMGGAMMGGEQTQGQQPNVSNNLTESVDPVTGVNESRATNMLLIPDTQAYAKEILGRIENKKKEENKQFNEDRAFHTEEAKEAKKFASQLRDAIPKKEFALNLARNALESQNLSTFSPDYLADKTGLEIFRTAKGAQLTTALKENFMNNMSRVSAKAQNVWFEKRLASMAPEIGRSKWANMTVQEIIEGELAMDKEYISTFDKLASEDRQNYGFVRGDIDERTRDVVKSKNKEIFNRTNYQLKEIEEQEKGLTELKKEVGKPVVQGTVLTLGMAKQYVDKFGDKAKEKAKTDGYTIPTSEELMMYQNKPEIF